MSWQLRTTEDTKELDAIVQQAKVLTTTGGQERTSDSNERCAAISCKIGDLKMQITELTKQVVVLTYSTSKERRTLALFLLYQVGMYSMQLPRKT